jgi:hypothetical protein
MESLQGFTASVRAAHYEAVCTLIRKCQSPSLHGNASSVESCTWTEKYLVLRVRILVRDMSLVLSITGAASPG